MWIYISNNKYLHQQKWFILLLFHCQMEIIFYYYRVLFFSLFVFSVPWRCCKCPVYDDCDDCYYKEIWGLSQVVWIPQGWLHDDQSSDLWWCLPLKKKNLFVLCRIFCEHGHNNINVSNNACLCKPNSLQLTNGPLAGSTFFRVTIRVKKPGAL